MGAASTPETNFDVIQRDLIDPLVICMHMVEPSRAGKPQARASVKLHRPNTGAISPHSLVQALL
jgi:hypothetical protein